MSWASLLGGDRRRVTPLGYRSVGEATLDGLESIQSASKMQRCMKISKAWGRCSKTTVSVHRLGSNYRFVVVVQLLSCVQLFETPWTASHQASVSFTISWSLLKLMSIESVMSAIIGSYCLIC